MPASDAESMIAATPSGVMPGAYHPSSWPSRRQRDEAASSGRPAWATADENLAMLIRAAGSATRSAFPHLDYVDILQPPHTWFDAALARQVMVTVLNRRLFVNRRVLSAVSLMSRETIHRAIRTVDDRSSRPGFRAMVDDIGDRADQIYRMFRTSIE